MKDEYNYGPTEHELAGGTFAEPTDMFGNDLTATDSSGTPVDADKVVVVLTKERAQALEWAVATGIEVLEASYHSHKDGLRFGQDVESAKDAHAMLQKALKDASHA